jgi:hypothetical protein
LSVFGRGRLGGVGCVFVCLEGGVWARLGAFLCVRTGGARGRVGCVWWLPGRRGRRGRGMVSAGVAKEGGRGGRGAPLRAHLHDEDGSPRLWEVRGDVAPPLGQHVVDGTGGVGGFGGLGVGVGGSGLVLGFGVGGCGLRVWRFGVGVGAGAANPPQCPRCAAAAVRGATSQASRARARRCGASTGSGGIRGAHGAGRVWRRRGAPPT